MKTIRLFILILFTVSTWAHAADNQTISNQAQENIQQMTKQMNALGIPEAKAQKMLTRMHQKRFQQQNIVRAQQTVMAAAKEGLPTEPIMNKAMEGMVKQAKEQQILKAMEAVRSRHQYAYQMTRSLSNDKNTTEIMARAIVDSLTAGMPVQDMKRIAAQLQTRQQTKTQAKDLSLQSMLTVRTMARLGAMPTDVSDTVCLALQHQYTSQQMKELRHNFASGTQQTSARQLARQYAGTIDKGGNPGNSNDGDKSSGEKNSGGGSDSGGAGSDGGSGGGSGGGGSR
ncbi:MAG: hypothetical protein KZQ81_16030 [Candidatus Thiodiazotropha sp. (ex Rostrolucina anterorostrata)]|nr:hypothetical protein [Candidatus Thiodiazotropha sp. (ex Rostrolucina anterorostrata)]